MVLKQRRFQDEVSAFWLNVILTVPNALGFFGMILAGRKQRFGWTLGLLSEVAWAVWAAFAHAYAIYPWIVAWSVVYVVNRYRWRRTGNLLLQEVPIGGK